MFQAFPTGTLLAAINTINLSLLMAKVTSLETIRPVSHLNVCALAIPPNTHTPPTPGSCLYSVIPVCWAVGVPGHPLTVMKLLTGGAFSADGFHSGLELLY